MTISLNMLVLIAILVALLIVPAMLPGNEYEQQAISASNWSIPMDYGCRVEMPHGKKYCEGATLMGSTVKMEGY